MTETAKKKPEINEIFTFNTPLDPKTALSQINIFRCVGSDKENLKLCLNYFDTLGGKVIITEDEKNIIVEDENKEYFRFELNKEWDGVELSGTVHYTKRWQPDYPQEIFEKALCEFPEFKSTEQTMTDLLHWAFCGLRGELAEALSNQPDGSFDITPEEGLQMMQEKTAEEFRELMQKKFEEMQMNRNKRARCNKIREEMESVRLLRIIAE